MSLNPELKHFDRVVLVDDDFVFRTCFEILLLSEGFAKEVLHFENGRQAMDVLKDWDPKDPDYPGVLFLDINMPVMDGWQFLEEFDSIPREERPELPIFVLSSSIDPRDLNRSREFEDVAGYIAKPLTRENLVYISQQFVPEDD